MSLIKTKLVDPTSSLCSFSLSCWRVHFLAGESGNDKAHRQALPHRVELKAAIEKWKIQNALSALENLSRKNLSVLRVGKLSTVNSMNCYLLADFSMTSSRRNTFDFVSRFLIESK